MKQILVLQTKQLWYKYFISKCIVFYELILSILARAGPEMTSFANGNYQIYSKRLEDILSLLEIVVFDLILYILN